MSKQSLAQMLKQAKPFLFLILQQVGYAGMSIISKFALNQGMSQHVLVVYRHAIAAAVTAPFAIVLERPVMDQNLYYTGMKFTTATFATAMCNVLPAFALIMAWIFRLEKVNIRKLPSQAKLIGTVVTVGGAMSMTLYNGPILNLPWTNQSTHHPESMIAKNNQVSAKGALMITAGCLCWSSFIILQAITLKSYPAELSLTAWMCLMGAVQGSVVALALEWGNPAAWSICSGSMILAALYSFLSFNVVDGIWQGIFRSGFAYYIQGLVMKEKGPVFVAAFNPVGLVIVVILGSFLLSEIMYLGRIIGAIIIIVGLYLVLWGKSKDERQSESSEKVSEPSTDENMTEKNETTKNPNRELVVTIKEDQETNQFEGTKHNMI
ncbi:Auxin-induced protein 5NG4 [Morus notabilis]|uniref:Auxin-induced protein 5NG4 n=1 Tax=Morus notabilis TaxID=981085 RepID=W9R276_9ROSA|nr:Auxin-induced protein 5NG4 [Morus notabilis]